MSNDRGQVADLLRLSMVHGVGPRTMQILLERFESATAVLDAPADQLAETGVAAKVVKAIGRARQDVDLEEQWKLCEKHGVDLLAPSSPAYPRALQDIADPPILFVRGQILPQDALGIAVVGSRHATYYGKTQAERLTSSLARAGLTIISGLARGIDAVAHRAAMAAGGRTLAVLGNGLDTVYPPEHKELAEEVAQQGALIAEVPMGAPPDKRNFPKRNRIISGMSLGILVVEAGEASGALVTARLALEQDRDVFAVPGPIDSRMSRGCHQLIRDGAKLVESAEDILEELGPLVSPAPTADGKTVHRPAELLLNEIESAVLAVVRTAPTSIDEVISGSGLTAPQVLSTLSILEMRRLVRRHSGNFVVRP